MHLAVLKRNEDAQKFRGRLVASRYVHDDAYAMRWVHHPAAE